MAQQITAVILAGGKGERLRPLTDIVAKPMIPVQGKPVLEHIINLFKRNGITNFICTLCYKPDSVTKYFGNGKKFGVTIQYTYEEENNPLGTAGSVSLSRNKLKQTFIVTSGDVLRKLNILSMLSFHKKNSAFATLQVYKRSIDNPKSLVVFDNNHRITSFIERPSLKEVQNDFVWANGSFYIFQPKIFEFIPNNQNIDFGHDIFPLLLKKQKPVFAYQTNEYFVDIGNKYKLDRAEKTFNIS